MAGLLASVVFAAMLFVSPALAEDEEAVVVGEDEAVIADEGDAADAGWNARPIPLREVGDRQAFIRQSSEAFDDPDERLSLELKYYFELPAEQAKELAESAGQMRGQSQSAAGAQLSAGPSTASAPWAAALPLPLGNAPNSKRRAEVEWLDYQTGPNPKAIVALLDAAAGSPAASLLVARVTAGVDGVQIDKQTAVRELDGAQLPGDCAAGGLLDVWDRPKSLGSRAMFLGRVIAVLKQIDGRYAVDFYGETLHPESDCRVWLWKVGAPQGRPQGIRFVEAPVKKGPDAVADVWTLAIITQPAEGEIAAVAIDYPLCRPAIMAQLQRAPAAGESAAPPPDLEKLVGADLLDEFARRLVNGTYR